MVVAKVGDQSTFQVRMSYSMKVRSVPILARTEDSDMLKRTEEMVSVDVGKERSEIGALLNMIALKLRHVQNNELTWFRPMFVRCWNAVANNLSGGDLLS